MVAEFSNFSFVRAEPRCEIKSAVLFFFFLFFFPALYLTKNILINTHCSGAFSLSEKHLQYENLIEISMEPGTRGNGILAVLARSCSF